MKYVVRNKFIWETQTIKDHNTLGRISRNVFNNVINYNKL